MNTLSEHRNVYQMPPREELTKCLSIAFNKGGRKLTTHDKCMYKYTI